MEASSDVAAKLAAFFVPMFALWLLIGVAIAVLYHLSMYYVEGDFREPGQHALDLLISVLRGLLYVVAWPFVFYFDRSALQRIKLLLLYLSPKQRTENEDLKDALNERKYWHWVRRSFLEQDRIERRRREELETGEERKRMLKVLHEGNPELDEIWMLTGVGAHPGGVKELVRLYPDYHVAEEIVTGARREIELRRPWNCLRCGMLVPVEQIELPELVFLRIVDPETEKMVVEGWALAGDYTMKLQPCPRCAAEQPELTEEVCRFGKASDVARMVRDGLSVHWDLP